MTNKKALDIVLGMAREINRPRTDGISTEEIEALAQMEDYYNDVLEDYEDEIITQGDKKLKEFLEN
jgi:hypothetical protein